MRRVVITGLGIVSCLGNNQNEVKQSLLNSKSGISFSEEYKEHNLKSHVHGKPNIKLEDHIDRKTIRFMGSGSAYNYIAMKEAIDEYGGKGRIRRAFTYKALNRLIQGSSADQTKKAMVDCYEAGLSPMLTVHDELCFNIENTKQTNQIQEIMCNCIPELKIPFEVDVEMGQNWGEVG